MMQLICDGVRLDVPRDAKLSTKKINPLFAFDKLAVERSTTFSLPTTPTNNNVFGLANIVANNGNAARRFHDAQLIDGTSANRCILYIVSVSSSSYECCLLLGDLAELKRARTSVKLVDLIHPIESCLLKDSPQADAGEENHNFIQMRYKRSAGGILTPSFPLVDLVDYAATASNVRVTTPSSVEYVRVIPDKPHTLIETSVSSSHSSVPASAWRTGTQSFVLGLTNTFGAELPNDISTLLGYDETKEISYRRHWQDYDFQTGQPVLRTENYFTLVRHMVAKQALTLVFPEDWPSNIYVGYFEAASVLETAFHFYGDRSFGKEWRNQAVTNRFGEPLAGRSVEIPNGALFMFVQEDDLLDFTQYTESTTTIETWEQGWKFVNALQISGFSSKGTHDAAEVGDTIRLADNLPDVTLIDLCKTIAAISGLQLNFDDANGITFDECDFSSWNICDLTGKVIDAGGDIKRQFGDYAQHNTIRFDSSKNVDDSHKITQEYTTTNETIEYSNELQMVPFSEGGVSNAEGYVVIYFDETKEATDKFTLANGTVWMPSPQPRYLQRVELPQNMGVSSLTRESTSLKISANMSRIEFDMVTSKTLLFYNGTLFVWTSSVFSEGVAEFECSKTFRY